MEIQESVLSFGAGEGGSRGAREGLGKVPEIGRLGSDQILANTEPPGLHSS